MRVLFGLLGLLAAAAATVAAAHLPGGATGATPPSGSATAGAGGGRAAARPHATATPGYSLTGVAPHRTRAGRPYLVAGVRDTGHEAIEAGGSAQLTGGPGGVSAGPVLARVLTLTPGRPGTLVFPFAAGLTPGPWRLTPAGGPVTRTVRTSITFPAKTGKSHGDNPAPATIWAASIIFVLVVITLIAAPRPHQRRRPPRTRHLPRPHMPHRHVPGPRVPGPHESPQRATRAHAAGAFRQKAPVSPRGAPRTGADTGRRTSPGRADPARGPR